MTKMTCAHKIARQGFTLIEALLYIALFVLIIGGGFSAAQLILQGTRSLEGKAMVEAEGNFLLRKIDWGVNGLTAITAPTAGNEGDVLRVQKPSGTVEFSIDADGDLVFDDGGGAVKLSSDRLSFSDCLVRHIPPADGAPRALEVSFKLNDQQFGTTTHYLR